MEEEQTTSPVPQSEAVQITHLSLGQALNALLAGDKITREEWDDAYAYMNDEGVLTIWHDHKDHQWVLSKPDLVATDWIRL